MASPAAVKHTGDETHPSGSTGEARSDAGSRKAGSPWPSSLSPAAASASQPAGTRVGAIRTVKELMEEKRDHIRRLREWHGAEPPKAIAEPRARHPPLDASMSIYQIARELQQDPRLVLDVHPTFGPFFHSSVYFLRIELVRLLLMHGADPNVRDRYGDTALEVAVNRISETTDGMEFDVLQCIRYLLDNGAVGSVDCVSYPPTRPIRSVMRRAVLVMQYIFGNQVRALLCGFVQPVRPNPPSSAAAKSTTTPSEEVTAATATAKSKEEASAGPSVPPLVAMARSPLFDRRIFRSVINYARPHAALTARFSESVPIQEAYHVAYPEIGLPPLTRADPSALRIVGDISWFYVFPPAAK